MVAQAYSGLMSITGPEGGSPCRVGSSVGDIIAGHQAAIGILAALITGRKQAGTALRWLHDRWPIFRARKCRGPAHNQRRSATATGKQAPIHRTLPKFPDKGFLDNCAIGNDALWAGFCKAIGREDLTDDKFFKTNHLRVKNVDRLIPLLAEEFLKKTSQEWGDIFNKAALPYSPINTIKDICADPHIRYRRMLVDIDQPIAGKMSIVGSSLHLSETPGEVYGPAPLLGQHSEEILADLLGFSREDIEALKREGVINTRI